MKKFNIHDAKTHLSALLTKLPKGESFFICRRNEPIAEVKKLDGIAKERRKIGLDKGTFKVTREFFEPLPDHFTKHFRT